MNKGNYYQATIDAISKLRSNPNKVETQDVLTQAYPLAVKTALRDISNVSLSNNPNKYDVMIANYEQLNRLANEIYASPKAMQLIPAPQEFHAELQQTKEIAAEQTYKLGLDAMKHNTLEQSRIAHQYFVKTNDYANGYRDVVDKLQQSLYAATLRVVVEPPQTPERFKISADFFYSNLVTEMNKTNQWKYVRFYTPEEAQNEGMRNPQQYLVLDFIDFTVGNVKESKTTTEVKRDSVVTGTVTVDGKKYDAYSTVKAQFTSYQREIVSGGKMNVRILDATNNRVIEQRAFNGSYVWKNAWATYTGDERTLSSEQIRLTKQKAELPPPNQDLFVEFTKPIYSQVVTYVRSAYRSYYVNQAK
ncbi:hypothetical protein FACS189446_0530 [Bacteroidia bacterium]|nr:hypothetical protein FACS189446_0530 [Bacteroidia bacterium]